MRLQSSLASCFKTISPAHNRASIQTKLPSLVHLKSLAYRFCLFLFLAKGPWVSSPVAWLCSCWPCWALGTASAACKPAQMELWMRQVSEPTSSSPVIDFSKSCGGCKLLQRQKLRQRHQQALYGKVSLPGSNNYTAGCAVFPWQHRRSPWHHKKHLQRVCRTIPGSCSAWCPR